MSRAGSLFTWDIGGKNEIRTKVHRLLYGYTDHSQFGKYKYERPGLLTKIRHLNPTQSCIIVSLENAQEVRGFSMPTE